MAGPGPDDLLARHRVILSHFDDYSTALLFAQWPGGSLLWPQPLPDGTVPVEASLPDESAAVLAAVVGQLALPADEVVLLPAFSEHLQAPDGTVHRVHLLRFTALDPPKALLAEAGAGLKPLPQLRGAAPVELALLREVFNLMVGGGGQRA